MPRANTLSRMSYARSYHAKRYERLKKEGLCRWCGKYPAKLNAKGEPGCRCEACAKIANKKASDNLRRRRPGWEALGICVVCGCRQAIQGQKWCAVCAERRDDTRKPRNTSRTTEQI